MYLKERENGKLIFLSSSNVFDGALESPHHYFVNYTTDTQIVEWIIYILENNLGGIFHVGTKDICHNILFQKELSEKLSLGKVSLERDKSPGKYVQAVLPGRNEIPESMQMSVKDVISYITEGVLD